MTLANPVGLVLQNLWLTWVYYVAFVVVTVLTGAWRGVLIAFVAASALSFAYRKFVNKTSASTRPPLLNSRRVRLARHRVCVAVVTR